MYPFISHNGAVANLSVGVLQCNISKQQKTKDHLLRDIIPQPNLEGCLNNLA